MCNIAVKLGYKDFAVPSSIMWRMVRRLVINNQLGSKVAAYTDSFFRDGPRRFDCVYASD